MCNYSNYAMGFLKSIIDNARKKEKKKERKKERKKKERINFDQKIDKSTF